MTETDPTTNDDSSTTHLDRSPTKTDTDPRPLDRRRLLAAGGAAISAALGGCSLLSRPGDVTEPKTGTSTDQSTPTAYPDDGTPYEPDDLTEAPRYNDDKEATPWPTIQSAEKGSDGPLVLIYSDYAQVKTRDFWNGVGPELDTYVDEGRARVMDEIFPVVNEWSWAVACAMFEIKDQLGNDPYWVYQEAILDHYGDYSYDLLESLADDIGADAARVRTAAEEGWRRHQILARKDAAEEDGIDYPPGVTVGFEPVEPTIEAITEAIENAE